MNIHVKRFVIGGAVGTGLFVLSLLPEVAIMILFALMIIYSIGWIITF